MTKRTEKSEVGRRQEVLGSSKLKLLMGSVEGDGDPGDFIPKFKGRHSLPSGAGSKDKLLARKLCN